MSLEGSSAGIERVTKSSEIIIPKDIARKLAFGCEKVVEELRAPTRPDVVIALLRSTTLYVPALRTFVEQRGLDLPPVLTAHIGHNITDRGPRLPDEIDQYAGSTLTDEDVINYQIWAGNDPECQRVCTQLQQQAARVNHAVRAPLIIDDIQRTNATQIAAKAIAQEAFNLQDTPHFIALLGYTDNVTSRILRASFPALERDGDVLVVLTEVLKGSRMSNGTLKGITTAEDIEAIAQTVADKLKIKNPLARVRKMFPDEHLLTLPEKVSTALATSIS